MLPAASHPTSLPEPRSVIAQHNLVRYADLTTAASPGPRSCRVVVASARVSVVTTSVSRSFRVLLLQQISSCLEATLTAATAPGNRQLPWTAAPLLLSLMLLQPTLTLTQSRLLLLIH